MIKLSQKNNNLSIQHILCPHMSEQVPESFAEEIEKYSSVVYPLDNREFLRNQFDFGAGLCFIFNPGNFEIKIWDATGEEYEKGRSGIISRSHISVSGDDLYRSLAGYIYKKGFPEITGGDVSLSTNEILSAIKKKIINELK
ncbi:MAG: hypothetical protein WCT40_00025 [Candidatus Magasanikbacteria bacterium]